MRFKITDLHKVGTNGEFDVRVFSFGYIAIIDGIHVKTELLENEEALERLISNYTANGYREHYVCDIDLPRDDLATKLVFELDKLHRDIDFFGYTHLDNFDDIVVYLEDLSDMRACLVVGDVSDILEAVDEATNGCEDDDSIMARASNLKQKILAYPNDVSEK